MQNLLSGNRSVFVLKYIIFFVHELLVQLLEKIFVRIYFNVPYCLSGKLPQTFCPLPVLRLTPSSTCSPYPPILLCSSSLYFCYCCSNIVVSIFSPPCPLPHPTPPPTLKPTPFGFVHVSFICKLN